MFDNFDNRERLSLSGKFSNHGTALTLFQVKSEKPPKKPDETQIDYTKVTIEGKVPAKKNSHFFGSKKYQAIVNLQKKALNEKKMQDLENLHFIVKAIRSMFLDQVESLPTWTTRRSLVSKAQTPLMYVGFLPCLPYCVKEYSTVYRYLSSFVKSQTQPNQIIPTSNLR